MKFSNLVNRHLKKCLWRISPKTFKAATDTSDQEFAIGIYTGDTPFTLSPNKIVPNPVLTHDDVNDIPAAFVADPFMCRDNNTWYMFFEIMHKIDWKGVIGLATSKDGLNWKYEKVILSEPFHLAYPHIFKWEDRHYMIPDTWSANGIRLYESSKFPYQWKYIGNILKNGIFLDSTIFQYHDKWWLYTATIPEVNTPPTLRLYFSDNLIGTWMEHPSSPIIDTDYHASRPAGKVLILDDKPIRFAQDIYPTYGFQVRAYQVSELSTTTYKEQPIENNSIILGPGDEVWNSGGMHHVDAHLQSNKSWIACVDGFNFTKK